MRQTTATEVRLDHGKAAGSGFARPSVSPFSLSAGRLRSNFVATRLDEQMIAPNHSESGECQINNLILRLPTGIRREREPFHVDAKRPDDGTVWRGNPGNVGSLISWL